MRDLHIILPMAGRGSRFANAGFTTPKPLIEVDGMPMFKKALSSLDGITAQKHHTVVMRTEHEVKYGLTKQLQTYLPGVNVVTTDETPMGALKDAMRAQPYLMPDEGVIILDCDLWFASRGYNQMVQDSLSGASDIDGGLLTFTADNPRYSYAELDENGMVTRTAEKQVISDRAITGVYYFARADDLIVAAGEMMQRPLDEMMPEYYISNLYNVLLARNAKIQATRVDEFASFGTPEELSAYEQH